VQEKCLNHSNRRIKERVGSKKVIPLENKITLDYNKKTNLKVLPNEKRGGLKVVSFDRSPFKLRFSNKSVQAPSSERPETAPRTLFLLFANNNCIPVSA
jgi:hypothetical protein